MPNRPKLGAVAVVIHEDSVVLVKRKKNPNAGSWGFPGGHVELGETGLECAERELAEETGISASALRYINNIDLIQHADDGSVAFHYLLVVVHCQYISGEPVAADDAADAAWFPIKEVLHGNQIPLTENVRNIVLAVLKPS